MNFRTLRAANHGLYLSASMMLLLICAYTVWRGAEPWQTRVAAAASLATLLWGGYYAGLRYQVDAEGVSRHTFFTHRRIAWADLSGAELEEHDSQSIAVCRIHLSSPAVNITLSSDVLSLDEVQDLAAEMREKGILPPLPEKAPEE